MDSDLIGADAYNKKSSRNFNSQNNKKKDDDKAVYVINSSSYALDFQIFPPPSTEAYFVFVK